jgi:AcrR family transcriptional regulator
MKRNQEFSYAKSGRVHQKERTRQALLQAARELLDEGRSATVAQAAQRALVSEATAYRYYSDASSLLRDALTGKWPELSAILAEIRASSDVALRARIAGEAMARHVLANESHIRPLISIAYSPGADASVRPGYRFQLIEAVLEPLAQSYSEGELRRLELALATVISAEACLTLKDVCGADDKLIVDNIGWTASQLVTPFLPRKD